MGIFGWDLPPGCRVSDIPGNRSEDEGWEAIYDNFWSKERLTKTHTGIRITEHEYLQMDKLYNSELADVIDDYIMAAIEYGMEIGTQQAHDAQEEKVKLTLPEAVAHEKVMGTLFCRICGIIIETRLDRLFALQFEGKCPTCSGVLSKETV